MKTKEGENGAEKKEGVEKKREEEEEEEKEEKENRRRLGRGVNGGREGERKTVEWKKEKD